MSLLDQVLDVTPSSPLSSPPPLSSASECSTETEDVVTPDRSLIQPVRKASFLLQSPSEIIHRVLLSSGVDDLPGIAATAKTCRELRSFIYESSDCALWRDIHLRRWDNPKKSGYFVTPRAEFDWKKRVQDREFVNRIFSWPCGRYGELNTHLDLIVDTLLDYYLDLPPLSSELNPSKLLITTTENSLILEELLRSSVFEYIMIHLSTRITRPLLRPLRAQPGNPNRKPQREAVNPKLCRLHTLLAPELYEEDEEHRQFRGRMREVVYSANNFTEKNDWGPFQTDGTVDWVLTDALATVMMSNAKDVLGLGEDGWRRAVLPLSYGLDPMRNWGWNVTRPDHLAEGEVWDWAGVEGEWCGSYAFLDYADWMSLNEPRLILLRRSINELDLSVYNEAIGDLMRLELVLDRPTDEPSDLPPLETPLPTSNVLPRLTFHGAGIPSGTTSFQSPSSSFVRGVVQLTADDPPQVRWTLVIRYGGEDRWRLECVQPGGRGSSRGFFGTWTDALKEDHSPNGPIWYWKP